MISRITPALLALTVFSASLRTSFAASNDTTRWITYQDANQQTVYLADNRQPALYTGNFGDCLGNSLINVTRFDAAYYKDNMTILFHMAGNSAIANESLMMYIGVYAYGESRFDLTFDPCHANIRSLCPLNSSIPISANGIIPIAQSDVANIPAIALSIPDFEGEAILRIFANSTQSEIGCYSAVVTNGVSFSQPVSVGTVLGIFTLVALLASFATAIYGEAVPTMRLHYAHSLSVGVVFAVWQHIFFTGALSMNWPSVLVAWWSNFAWAGGMIYSETMQSSINNLIGNNVGNTSQVGAAPAGSTQNSLGGGYDISLIYKRAFRSGVKRAANHPLSRDIASQIYKRAPGAVFKRDIAQRTAEQVLRRDNLANSTTGYTWYGHPVAVGLPLPGNYSGFAGTLGQEGIRVSNAFMTGLLWFLILLVGVVAAIVAVKWALEGLARVKAIKQDRLAFFRQHWLGYSASVALRTCFLAWFMIMLLAIFQFTYQSSGGVKAVAAIVFAVFLVAIPGIAAYACYYKVGIDSYESNPDRFQTERKKLLGKIPCFCGKRLGPTADNEDGNNAAPLDSKSSTQPFWKRMSSRASLTDSQQHMKSIHDDEDYIMKFGWLAGRFRRTRWWFFVFWLFYEFLRACFYGGASGHPLIQVFGLLAVEILAFAFIAWARPFEGRRLNLIVVYCLGFSKVASVALSAAFDVQFNLARIPTTAIGIVIIVIQGTLTIITLIGIAVGVISSYMSISRNHEDFRPKKWHGLREKYFDHLDRVINDLPREPKPAKWKPQQPAEPEEERFGFEMKSVRRQAKIEDEDPQFTMEKGTGYDPAASYLSLDDRAPTPGGFDGAQESTRSETGTPARRSLAASIQSMGQSTLPFGARAHRPSWSSRDIVGSQTWVQDSAEPAYRPVDVSQTPADDDPVVAPTSSKRRSWTPSRSAALSNPKLRAQTSNTSLQVGGEESTTDTIGKVPAPAVRPRASTYGSRISSRNSYVAAENSKSAEMLSEMLDSNNPGSQRGSRYRLTPAQEMEEWSTRDSEERR